MAEPGPDSPPTLRVRADGRLLCPRCAAPYRPDLVDGRCPVCAEDTPGWPHASGRALREEERTVLLVGLATLVNLLLLGLLAVWVLHA